MIFSRPVKPRQARMRWSVASDPAETAAFQLQHNRWKGRVELQAKLVDLRPAS